MTHFPASLGTASRHALDSTTDGRSLVSGMGAVVVPEGVSFRVWAPNAKGVSVIGEFNHWNDHGSEMTKEANGTWSLLLPDAREGQEYRYLIHTDGPPISRPDPRALRVTNSQGNSVIWKASRTPRRLNQPVPQDRMVIYEMHLGSFNPLQPDKPGTFGSAIEKLDHLANLGVNAIELMPIAEFAGDFSWGYNSAYPFAVESAYGGPDGLIEFVDAAHERGMAVILDVVYNHFGPSDLCLWRFDGWSENNLGGIYFYNDWRASTPWGDTRPDYGRGEVRSFIRDNAIMWLETFGIDGLRWDMSVYIRTCKGNGEPDDDLKEGWGLLQWVNTETQRLFPGTICIAEDLRDNEWLVKSTDVGGAGFTAQWSAGFVHPIRSLITEPRDEERSLTPLVDAISGRFDGDAFKRVIYTESHDEVANGKTRVPAEIDPEDADGYFARKRSTLGAVIVATAPGIPMLFQGQEFLEDQWFRDKVPLDFAKLDRFPGIFQLYKDLIRLRLDAEGPTRGLTGQDVWIHHVNHQDKVLGYVRSKEGQAHVLVVLNLSHRTLTNYEVGVPVPGVWRTLFNSDSRLYCADFGDTPCNDAASSAQPRDGMQQSISIAVGGYSGLILTLATQS